MRADIRVMVGEADEAAVLSRALGAFHPTVEGAAGVWQLSLRSRNRPHERLPDLLATLQYAIDRYGIARLTVYVDEQPHALGSTLPLEERLTNT